MTSPAVHKPRRGLRRVGVIVVVAVLLVFAAGVGVQYWRSNRGVDAASTQEPAVLVKPGTDGKGVTVGSATAKSTIEVYVDFRCPHCEEFEEEARSTINELVDSGAAKLTYNPLAFVSDQDSPRTANAFGCAAAEGKARGYHDGLFANFILAWTDEQLVELGTKVELTGDTFAQCVTANTYAGWVSSVGKAAAARGVQGTPTVFVNGTRLPPDQLSAAGIRAAVE